MIEQCRYHTKILATVGEVLVQGQGFYVLPHLSQRSVGWVWVRGWERTKLGRVSKLTKRIFPYHILSNKDEGNGETAASYGLSYQATSMHTMALKYFWCCLTMRVTERTLFFLCLYGDLLIILQLSLSWSTSFSTLFSLTVLLRRRK